MRVISFLLIYTVVIISLPVSCKKDYVRPDHYALDLFENERNEQHKKILSADESLEKSLLVIKSSKIELISSQKISKKTLYIYNINDGRMIKKVKDSIGFPIRIIADQVLKTGSGRTDSATIYLIAPGSYRLLIVDLGVKYQILPSSPAP